MRLFVDAHCLIWWLDQDHLLSKTAYDAIADPGNQFLVRGCELHFLTNRC
jgi:PIN domain nuclease of toxin-antitoxin system